MKGCRYRRVINLNLLLIILIVLCCIVILVKWEQRTHRPARMEYVGTTHQSTLNSWTTITPKQVLEQKPKQPTQQVTLCNDIYSTNLMPAGTFPLVALASFPGSGDTWVRSMIERATGYATGSVYHIQSYEKDFIGEMRNVAAGETIVSKMHDYWRGYTNNRDGQISIEKAILIMRNPYRAMIDEFIRLGFGKKGMVDENRFRSEAWSVFVSETFKFSRWLKLSRTLFDLCNHPDANSRCSSILIVYYDSLEKNLEDELRRIMNFLDVGVDEHHLSCSVASADASPHRPQPPNLSFDPFTKEHHERLDEDLKTFHQWLEEEGLPQSPPTFSLNTLRSFKKRTTPSYPPPPSPTGLPFFGNLFSFQEDMRDLFRKWTNEIGGIFRLRIGPVMDIVVINDVEAIREAFVEKADAFSDRMVPPLLGIALGQRGSLIWPAGDEWKKTRKFGHNAFRSMGLGQRRIEDKVIEEGRILVQACEMKEGEPFNPRVLITNAVGNIIACLLTGSRYDYDDPDFVKIVNNIDRLSENTSLTSLGNVFPFLYYTPLYTNFRRPMQDIVSYIKSMVKQHQQNFDPLNVQDIIDLYMVELKQQREQQISCAVEENLEWRLIVELYLAGMVTTSDSLLWAILIVAQHSQLMKEIQKEIDDVICEGRSPKMSDRDALPLIVATLMEVSRIRPVLPLALPRLTSRDATVQGYHIPKDTVVMMNLWEVLNSPKYWDKPEEFNPYRFLSEDRLSVVDHPAFIPFGIGLRACLGEKLARMQMFIIFTSLLQRFTFCLADDSRSVGMKGKAGIAYSPLKYDIILKRRENSN